MFSKQASPSVINMLQGSELWKTLGTLPNFSNFSLILEIAVSLSLDITNFHNCSTMVGADFRKQISSFVILTTTMRHWKLFLESRKIVHQNERFLEISYTFEKNSQKFLEKSEVFDLF